jgi:hypothetical protein
MLCKKAKNGPGVEVLGIDRERRKSHEDANGHAAIAVANPLARTFRHGRSSGATSEEVYSFAATRNDGSYWERNHGSRLTWRRGAQMTTNSKTRTSARQHSFWFEIGRVLFFVALAVAFSLDRSASVPEALADTSNFGLVSLL